MTESEWSSTMVHGDQPGNWRMNVWDDLYLGGEGIKYKMFGSQQDTFTRWYVTTWRIFAVYSSEVDDISYSSKCAGWIFRCVRMDMHMFTVLCWYIVSLCNCCCIMYNMDIRDISYNTFEQEQVVAVNHNVPDGVNVVAMSTSESARSNGNCLVQGASLQMDRQKERRKDETQIDRRTDR